MYVTYSTSQRNKTYLFRNNLVFEISKQTKTRQPLTRKLSTIPKVDNKYSILVKTTKKLRSTHPDIRIT